MLRTIANLGLSLLLVAVLVWGGCLACPQVSHKCCNQSQHCTKVSTVQAMALPGAANGAAPIAVAVAPAAAVAPPVQPIVAVSRTPLVVESPPDLCKLHSVFRI